MTTHMKKGWDVRRVSFWSILVLSLLSFSCTGNQTAREQEGAKVSSPNGDLAVYFQLKNGIPFYRIEKEGETLFNDSRLGLQSRDMPSYDKNLIISEVKQSVFDSSWVEKQGGLRTIRNHYNSLLIQLEEQQEPGRKIQVIFRIYNDGIRFRYKIPGPQGTNGLLLQDELTEFSLANNYNVWWIPAYVEKKHQPVYRRNKVSELSEAVQLPLAMEYGDSLFVSIHESASTAYAATTLVNNGNNTFKIDLISKTSQGRKTRTEDIPWRTIQIAEKPEDLFTSYLVASLSTAEELKKALKPVQAEGVRQAKDRNGRGAEDL